MHLSIILHWQEALRTLFNFSLELWLHFLSQLWEKWFLAAHLMTFSWLSMYSHCHNFSFPLKLFLPFPYYQKHVRCFFIRGRWQIMSTQIVTYSVLQTVCHFFYPSFWQLWSIEMGLSLKECECFSLTLVSWTIVWASEPKYLDTLSKTFFSIPNFNSGIDHFILLKWGIHFQNWIPNAWSEFLTLNA